MKVEEAIRTQNAAFRSGDKGAFRTDLSTGIKEERLEEDLYTNNTDNHRSLGLWTVGGGRRTWRGPHRRDAEGGPLYGSAGGEEIGPLIIQYRAV